MPGAPQDWKKIAKAEVNPTWFWRVVGRGRRAARPRSSRSSRLRALGLEADRGAGRGPRAGGRGSAGGARGRAKKLFAAGKYEESLAKFRQVLARSPNNEEARKYAQMAESAAPERVRPRGPARARSADRSPRPRTALDEGKDDEAKAKAEEALASRCRRTPRPRRFGTRPTARSPRPRSRRRPRPARRTRRRPRRSGEKKDDVPTAVPVARAAAAAPQRSGRPAPAPVPGNATLRLVVRLADPRGPRHGRRQRPDPAPPALLFQERARAAPSPRTSRCPRARPTIKVWLSGPDMAVRVRHDQRPALRRRDADAPARLRRRQARRPPPVAARPRARPFAETPGIAYKAAPPRGVAQPGSALGSGPSGRRFKSSRPDQSSQSLARGFLPRSRAITQPRQGKRDIIRLKYRSGEAGEMVVRPDSRSLTGRASVLIPSNSFGIVRGGHGRMQQSSPIVVGGQRGPSAVSGRHGRRGPGIARFGPRSGSPAGRPERRAQALSAAIPGR